LGAVRRHQQIGSELNLSLGGVYPPWLLHAKLTTASNATQLVGDAARVVPDKQPLQHNMATAGAIWMTASESTPS